MLRLRPLPTRLTRICTGPLVRPISCTAPRLKKKKKPGPKPIEPSGPMRNQQILKAHAKTRLLDPQTGELGPPTPTQQLIDYVLSLHDIKTETKRAVDVEKPLSKSQQRSREQQLQEQEEKAQDSTPKVKTFKNQYYLQLVASKPDPIVKIVSIKDEFERREKVKTSTRSGKTETKEVQISWSADPKDLQHKVDKIRDALLKKYRVDVAIAPKSQQALPQPHEMEARIQEIIDLVSDIGEEREARTFERRVAIIRLQRNSKSQGPTANEK